MPGGEEGEPFNNRYYYTYETKPTGKTSTVTISKTEAFVKDTIKSIMAKGVAEVVEAVVPGNQEMKEKASGIAEDFTRSRMPGLVPIRLPRQRSTNTVWTDWMRARDI